MCHKDNTTSSLSARIRYNRIIHVRTYLSTTLNASHPLIECTTISLTKYLSVVVYIFASKCRINEWKQKKNIRNDYYRLEWWKWKESPIQIPNNDLFSWEKIFPWIFFIPPGHVHTFRSRCFYLPLSYRLWLAIQSQCAKPSNSSTQAKSCLNQIYRCIGPNPTALQFRRNIFGHRKQERQQHTYKLTN